MSPLTITQHFQIASRHIEDKSKALLNFLHRTYKTTCINSLTHVSGCVAVVINAVRTRAPAGVPSFSRKSSKPWLSFAAAMLDQIVYAKVRLHFTVCQYFHLSGWHRKICNCSLIVGWVFLTKQFVFFGFVEMLIKYVSSTFGFQMRFLEFWHQLCQTFYSPHPTEY